MRFLYRADTREPTEIFTIGFNPRFKGGINIRSGGQMTGGVSTSKELPISMNYAACYGGYVYGVTGDGVNVVEHLIKSNKNIKTQHTSALTNALTQMEVACKKIRPENVILARKANKDDQGNMTWEGPLIINPAASVDKNDPSYKSVIYLFNLLIVRCVP